MRSVNLKEITDKLDEVDEEWLGFHNTETGEIIMIGREYMAIAEESEEGDDFSEYQNWEQESLAQAMEVTVNWERYKKLPDKFDIDEYSIMEDFSYSYPDEAVSEKLTDAIRGKGAFRRFKDMIDRLGITGEWYAHREKALADIAREWCEFHKIPYTE